MPRISPQDFPWYSDDHSAFRSIPMALNRSATVPGHSTMSMTYYGERLPGLDGATQPVSEFSEQRLLSLMLASSGFTILAEHIEGAANDTLGIPFPGWWRVVELDRGFHAPRLSTAAPAKPGDLDLVMGPRYDRPRFDWLVGVEMKRFKFSCSGVNKVRMDKIDEAVEQAHGYWKLGFDQVLLAPLIVIQPEPWSLDPHGRERRNEVHDRAVHKLLQEIDKRVPSGMGVIGLLYDAPPYTDPRSNAEVSIYKFRRPGVNPERRDLKGSENRLALEEALERVHELAPGHDMLDVIRACMHKQCRRPVRVPISEAWGCPACGRPWIEKRTG